MKVRPAVGTWEREIDDHLFSLEVLLNHVCRKVNSGNPDHEQIPTGFSMTGEYRIPLDGEWILDKDPRGDPRYSATRARGWWYSGLTEQQKSTCEYKYWILNGPELK